MPPQAVRPLALVAILGGAVFVILGVVQLTNPEQADPFSRTSDYLIEALRALALLLTLAGFVALHLLQVGRYGGPRGWTGFRAAVVGQGAILASAVASLAAGASALGALSVLGTFVLLVALALLSVATHKAALLPVWSAYLVAALAVFVFGEPGTVVVGLVWIALGSVLWSKGSASAAGGPSRVT
jgi:hypothetical protein